MARYDGFGSSRKSPFGLLCLGNRIVNVEPRPGSLSTVMSPPIIWQNRLLIARPRPVPPYLLAVAVEACERYDRERRAATRLALDRNVAAHHLAEAFADREAKAGATVFAGGRESA